MPTRRPSKHVMAYVTAPDRASARRIADAVLENRFAACANLVPIESVYWWKGSLEKAKEVLLVFKTRGSLLPALIRSVKAVHPYEVPCIVAYPMEGGFVPYLAWIDRETRRHR